MASCPITSWELEDEEVETVRECIFLGSKITADGDCRCEIKRHLLLGRKARKNLDILFKSRDVTLPTRAVVVQLLSPVWLFAIPWTAASQSSLSFTISQGLLKLIFIESVMPSSHLILCRPLLLLPSIFPSIRLFSNELSLRIRWPKYWSFSYSISPSNEYSGLISFKTDWCYLVAVQGTLKSLLQHHSSKASMNALMLSLIYGPNMTSTHDYWKNHSFD